MKKLNCFLITIIFFTICSCEKRESEFNPPPYPYELCKKENTYTITVNNTTNKKCWISIKKKERPYNEVFNYSLDAKQSIKTSLKADETYDLIYLNSDSHEGSIPLFGATSCANYVINL